MLVFGAALAVSMAAAAAEPETHTNASPAWELVWSDEFETPGLPDKAKWDYEKGYVRNGEPQFYTRGRLENARVEDGMLVLEARKDAFDISGLKALNHGRAAAAYTSASLTTRNRAAWRYGRIEARAKLPAGSGMWPAIWTLGANIKGQDGEKGVGWPACGEIDIMESWRRWTNTVEQTVHFRRRTANTRGSATNWR